MSNPAYQGISIYDGPGNTLTYKQDSVTSIWSIPELGAQIAGSAVPQYVQYMGANKSGNLVGMLLDASGNLLVDVSSQSYTNYGSPAVSALNVYVVNPSSGGGTQYTDGTVESSGAFSITVAGSYNGTGVVGLRSDSSDNLLVRLTDSVHPITAAVSAWGVAPTGTFVMGVNAELMAGSVALTAQAGGYLNTALYTGTTAVTTATFGTTAAGSGILTNSSLFIGTTVLAAESNYGTAPSAVAAMGVNAFVTNIVEVSPTTAANTASNAFFNQITDGTNPMGAMANFGTTPTAVKALNANASLFVGTVAAASAASGVLLVGVEGHAGGAFDAAQGAAAPANVLSVGGVYNTSLPTISNLDISAFQIDAKGQIYVDLNYFAGAAFSATNAPWSIPTDGTNAMGAMAHFGTAPSSSVYALNANAELFAGQTALTAQTGGFLNVALYAATTALTAATFGTTNSGSGILTNASLFIGTTVASAATAGVQLVGIEGHAGGVFDAAQGGATPANLIQIGGVIGGVGVGTTVGAINVSGTGTQLVQDVVDAAASSINFFGAISSTSALTAITGAYPVLSIQPNNGSILFRLRGFDVFSNGSICAFQLLRNATLGGGTNFVAGPTGSNMKYDVSSTTVSGGVLVDAGFVGEQKTRDKLLAIYMKGTTTTDILTLVLTPTGSSASVGAAFQWSEQAAAL